MTKKFKPAIDRFMSKFEKHESGCWIWKANIVGGCGQFNLTKEKRMIVAHRFSYLHFVGEIPEGMFVKRKCNNPLCINPDHLFISKVRK